MDSTQKISSSPYLAGSFEPWPALPYPIWKDTYATLHMWLQIVGKVRLTLSPYTNHWWQVPFYLTGRGITTSPIPYPAGSFEILFDFIDHNLLIQTSQGEIRALPLLPRSVAAFYQEVMEALHALDIQVAINPLPNEVPDPISFAEDTMHASYDPVYVNRCWRILLQTDKVMKVYRAHFIGKSSPIHFFWGSFDLALTFFSGQPAPPRPGADRITREAYSHEVISCGFWPGGESFPEPAFYSYTVPEPAGMHNTTIQPATAFHSAELSEFFLRYEDVRNSKDPESTLLSFFQSTYEAGVTLAHWDREKLEHTVV